MEFISIRHKNSPSVGQAQQYWEAEYYQRRHLIPIIRESWSSSLVITAVQTVQYIVVDVAVIIITQSLKIASVSRAQ